MGETEAGEEEEVKLEESKGVEGDVVEVEMGEEVVGVFIIKFVMWDGCIYRQASPFLHPPG